MKKENNQLNSKHYTHHFKYGVSFAWAFTGTMLVASSIAQASDMQIYANPTAGKKTIVMMLDTSGSMNFIKSDYDVCTDSATFNGETTSPRDDNKVYIADSTSSSPYQKRFCYVKKSRARDVPSAVSDENTGCEKVNDTTYKCYDRLTRLKDGMFAFLNSNAPELPNVRVGLGNYSAGGDGKSGQILVAAKELGPVNSTHRNALKNAIKDLTARSGTPTAHAYAEAASYLMGTKTVASQQLNNADFYFAYSYTSRGRTYYEYSECNGWNSAGTSCNSWGSFRSGTPPSTTGLTPASCNITINRTNYSGTCYRKTGIHLFSNDDSGFDKPAIGEIRTDLNYNSPLPAVADRVSCDGQGVYILSDGAANSTDEDRSKTVMSAALGSTDGNGFSCLNTSEFADAQDPTSTGRPWGYWHCMGAFAKKLFNKDTNPARVSIQTAFVGFGKDMSSLTQPYVQRACALSSRAQSDRSGDDACSPNQGANAVASPGYGNGGFFTTQSAQGVTDSVIAFINNLGVAPLEPLTTGSISVPSDALSPSGLQPYGYLRALEPNPQSSTAIWAGNLKRYKVVLSGDNAGAFASANGTTLVYDAKGAFRTNTKDLWNSNAVYDGNSYNDGGVIGLGGALSRVPMPILGQAQDLTKTPKQYAFAARPNALRNLFTDVAANGGATLAEQNSGTLLRIPGGTRPTTDVPAYVLTQFNEQETLKDFPLAVKQKLLNYLGFSVPVDGATALPNPLPTPAAPHLAMGGSVHSFPVQLTYSGTLDASGRLTSTREQSILYGTMDGGLHLVDSTEGVEQMVFVPSEILRDANKSNGLVKGASSSTGLLHGVDGAWVADALYRSVRATSASENSRIEARQMNIYGGLRMGGESYYGLNVLDPKNPKLLFRVGSDQSDFNRMGQSWSKPVIANIRHEGEVKRVMIVGGGYDVRYEDPTFALTGSNVAKGNAIYIIDAKTGDRLWWASSTGANTNNANMKHSIVSRISAIDRNGDGLIDHLYFGDLGGQVFRADLDNNQIRSGSSYSVFGKRVVRLANLATTVAGADLTDGKNPRFYEAPTVTIHDQGANTFMVVGIASGNRSTPLDVYPTVGRDGMSPATALTDRLVNNVYGILDKDFSRTDLITGNPTPLTTQDLTLAHLQKDPQITLTGNIPATFIGDSATRQGWYRSLSSNSAGIERSSVSGGSFRIAGGMKAFEEPIALTGNLLVPVYDPQGTGIVQQDPCKPRVIGESDSQRFCLPYGVCINLDGTKNSAREEGTGFKTKTENCPPGVQECNDNLIGGGIVGLAPVPVKPPTDDEPCPDFSIAGNERGNGQWKCIPTINPTRWYERWKK